MANTDSTVSNIGIVKGKINQLTLDLIAIHELVIDSFGNRDAVHYETLLQRMTELCARELENCSVLLGDGNGIATHHFDRYGVQS